MKPSIAFTSHTWSNWFCSSWSSTRIGNINHASIQMWLVDVMAHLIICIVTIGETLVAYPMSFSVWCHKRCSKLISVLWSHYFGLRLPAACQLIGFSQHLFVLFRFVVQLDSRPSVLSAGTTLWSFPICLTIKRPIILLNVGQIIWTSELSFL